MARTALAVLSLAAVLGGLAGVPSEVRAAPPEAVRVETAYRARAGWRPDRADPADRLARAQPEPLDLDTAPPAGLRRLPAADRLLFGVLRVARQSVPIVFGLGSGAEAVVAVDRDRDGDPLGPGESTRLTGAAATVGERETLTWRLPSLDVGGALVEVTLVQTAPRLEAVLVAQDPVALVLRRSPSRGISCPRAAGTVWFTEVQTPGGAVPLGFRRQGEDGLQALLDRNGNGVLGEGGEVVPVASTGAGPGARYWEAEGLAVGSWRVHVALQELSGEIAGSVEPAGARRGRVEIEGRSFALHLLDLDLDGAYDSAGDLWWFGPLEHLAQVRRLRPEAMVETTEPVFLEVPWRLASVDQTGNAILIQARDAPSRHDYFRRRAERVNRTRWFPVFAREAERFRQEHGIDARRPRAAEPPHWLHDVDLREGLARARAEGRPLLVDFEADWCAWCKRYDYYVYPDAEVAALLSRFVLVKVNAEFHFAGDLERLGGDSLPLLAVLDPEGQPLAFPVLDGEGRQRMASGPVVFEPPARFAETLRAAYGAWIRRQER